MTKTRLSSNTPALSWRPATNVPGVQGCWSDDEDSMGYHAGYPVVGTNTTTSNDTTPANIAPATKAAATQESMTNISIGGIMTKIPTRMAASNVANSKRATKLFDFQGCYSDGEESPIPHSDKPVDPKSINKLNGDSERITLPLMPVTKSLIHQGLWKDCEQSTEYHSGYGSEAKTIAAVYGGTGAAVRAMHYTNGKGYATDRPWSDEDALVGYHSAYHNNAIPASSLNGSAKSEGNNAWAPNQDIVRDELENAASCAAVSPDVVLSSLSNEVVPLEATMERYGRILHELPGEEKRKAKALMESIEELFPGSIREDRWYLSAIGALIGSGLPHHTADLYLYLISKSTYRTPTQRQALVRRMREALLKTIPITGMAMVTEAFTALIAVEAPEDQDHTFTWESKRITPERLQHARETIAGLHRTGDESDMYSTFGNHKDLAWITENITYGLFLADHSILSLRDTELVAFPALLCTGLAGLAEAHMRACLGLGFKVEEVEQIHMICEMIAGWKGTSLRGKGVKRAAELDM